MSLNQSQKTKLTIFVIISILVIALSGLIGFDLADIKQSKQVDNSVDISKKWQECLDHYQKEELKSAESCVTPFVLQFADLEQGCELRKLVNCVYQKIKRMILLLKD